MHLSDKRERGIQDIPIPKSVSSICIFVGMVNYFLDFIPSLSSYLEPLTDLTKKKNFGENEFEITEKAISAFKIVGKRPSGASYVQRSDERLRSPHFVKKCLVISSWTLLMSKSTKIKIHMICGRN